MPMNSRIRSRFDPTWLLKLAVVVALFLAMAASVVADADTCGSECLSSTDTDAINDAIDDALVIVRVDSLWLPAEADRLRTAATPVSVRFDVRSPSTSRSPPLD